MVCIGYDTPRKLGDRETGGGLALPVWIEFMSQALKGVPVSEPAPPEDDEHHTLPDGTALHVTVWTAPGAGVPEVVLPMPAAEGWTQQVR